MTTQQFTKPDLVTGKDVEDDGLEMRSMGKDSGTDADMQDMRRLGRKQQLNVSMVTLVLWTKQLIQDSATFASSQPSASPVL
jgi:hypothetical protein